MCGISRPGAVAWTGAGLPSIPLGSLQHAYDLFVCSVRTV
jgi:hypothetical protein